MRAAGALKDICHFEGNAQGIRHQVHIRSCGCKMLTQAQVGGAQKYTVRHWRGPVPGFPSLFNEEAGLLSF